MPGTKVAPAPRRPVAARTVPRPGPLRRPRVARFLTVFLFALVAGVFWGTWLGLSRSIASMSPQAFLEVGWIMIRNLATPMAILMLAALTSGAVLLIRTFRWDARASVVWTTAGWGLLAAALVVTLAVNVPIDSEIQYWTLSSLPENWRELRDRWEFYHGLRTLLSIVALAAVTVGAVIPRAGDDSTA
jgi:hypothetical protein